MKKVFLLPAILLAFGYQVRAHEVPSDTLTQIQLEEVVVSSTRAGKTHR